MANVFRRWAEPVLSAAHSHAMLLGDTRAVSGLWDVRLSHSRRAVSQGGSHLPR